MTCARRGRPPIVRFFRAAARRTWMRRERGRGVCQSCSGQHRLATSTSCIPIPSRRCALSSRPADIRSLPIPHGIASLDLIKTLAREGMSGLEAYHTLQTAAQSAEPRNRPGPPPWREVCPIGTVTRSTMRN